MSNRKDHFVSIMLNNDGASIIVYTDFDTDNAVAHRLPGMTFSELRAFVMLIDPRMNHIAINDERMPKRAAMFKIDAYVEREWKELFSAESLAKSLDYLAFECNVCGGEYPCANHPAH